MPDWSRRGDRYRARRVVRSLRILLSFDHELSLGGSPSYARDLFEPTREILKLASDLEVPITLFTDVCCALRFREWDKRHFFEPFVDQVQRTIREGHDVQLHLHPHWIDTEYRGGRFRPSSHYSLGCFERRTWPNDIHGIVERGVSFLQDLCLPVDSRYCCIAFRAGGFCLAPATGRILSALYESGIRIDSSIAKGNTFSSQLWSVDHRCMPDQANWYISPDGPIDQSAGYGLYEIPIASRPRTPTNNLPFLVKRVMHRRRRYLSGGWPIDAGNVTWQEKLKRLMPNSAWMLGFDNHADDVDSLMRILQWHVEQHWEDGDIVCSAISHPKFMGKHALSLMDGFVRRVRSKYGGLVRFCTYRDVYWESLAMRETELERFSAGASG